MKRAIKYIALVIGLTSLTTILFSQSYVNDWPIQSLQPSSETLQQLEHQNDDIPYYLQNRTFRDTIYDTISWETIEDIDYVFFKALGTESSYYSLDIEILDNGDFLVPWYNDTSFFITRLDSLGEEIYTNHYSNIDRASVDCYRDGKYVYMAGRINMDTAGFHQNHIALIKYDLETNDTAFVRIVAPCEYQVHGVHLSAYVGDSIFYVLGQKSFLNAEYIYVFDKNAFLIDSVFKGNKSLYGLFEWNDQLYVVERYTEVYSLSEVGLTFVNKFLNEDMSSFYFDDNFYLRLHQGRFISFNSMINLQYFSFSQDPGFSNGGVDDMVKDDHGNIVAAFGINTFNWWPPDQNSNIGLYKLDKNGNWLHKLSIGGATFTYQRIYELFNKDYLVIANADVNQTGNGTIFFMRMKPWQDNVGIADLHAKKEITIYPNPAKDEIFIKTDEITGIVGINIFDITGRKVYSEYQNSSDPINISTLQNGLHSIVITSNSNLYYSKFIKH